MDTFAGYCGLYCQECKHRESTGCQGCKASKGTLFWGTCEVATCYMSKEHAHCGQCQDFPCATLKEYAFSETSGDNGERIKNLQAWQSVGFEAWSQGRQQ